MPSKSPGTSLCDRAQRLKMNALSVSIAIDTESNQSEDYHNLKQKGCDDERPLQLRHGNFSMVTSERMPFDSGDDVFHAAVTDGNKALMADAVVEPKRARDITASHEFYAGDPAVVWLPVGEVVVSVRHLPVTVRPYEYVRRVQKAGSGDQGYQARHIHFPVRSRSGHESNGAAHLAA